VRLEGDKNKDVVVKVKNVQKCVQPEGDIASNALTCKFLLGTPEEEVFATVKNMYGANVKEELQILFLARLSCSDALTLAHVCALSSATLFFFPSFLFIALGIW